MRISDWSSDVCASDLVLRHAGHRVTTLKSDTVATDRREDWVARKVKEGLDVLMVNPRLVQTGLDLIDLPTLEWLEEIGRASCGHSVCTYVKISVATVSLTKTTKKQHTYDSRRR